MSIYKFGHVARHDHAHLEVILCTYFLGFTLFFTDDFVASTYVFKRRHTGQAYQYNVQDE